MKNFFALLLGILIAFLLLESIFDIASKFLHPSKVVPDQEAYKILCVGDSSTFGLGANDPLSESYPAILEKLLQSANSGKIQVINLGLPGINSSQTLSHLIKNIAVFSPELILVCTGINDPWNWEESKMLKFYDAKGINKWKIKILYYLQKLKTIRFLKLCLMERQSPYLTPEFNKDTVEKNNKLLADQTKQKTALTKTIEHNLNKIYCLAKKHQSQVFFLEYHAPGWENPEIIIHSLYKELNLPYIPLFHFFNQLDSQNKPIRSKDAWHLNSYGYKILAEKILSELHGKIPVDCYRDDN